MRLDDPSDNAGRGWRRLSLSEIADLAYMAIRLAKRSVRVDLAAREAAKADEASRKLADAVSRRLEAYPTFGPEKPAEGHSARCNADGQSKL